MKGNFLHIGSAVLGFLFVVQNAYAQVPPETDRLVQIFPEEVSQIDAEEASVESVDEVSSGNEGSHIRFSDTDRVAPAIKVPSQQSMSSLLVQDGYLLDVQYESLLEQHSIRPSSSQTGEQNQQNQRYLQDQQDQRYQDDQQDNQQDQRYQRDQDQQRRQQDQRDQRRQQDQEDQQYQRDDQQDQRYQRDQNQQRRQQDQRDQQRRQDQDQRRDQQQRDQRNQRNENGWDWNEESICPYTDDERCYYPESQRKRCELFDGIYIDGVCYMRDDRNTRHEECEREGGIYMNDQCYMESRQNNSRDRDQRTDRERCEDMGGQYRNGSCSIEYDDYDRYQRNSWKGGEEDSLLASTIPMVRTEKREACEDKGGEYIGNGKCIIRYYDQDKCEDKGGTFYEDECFIDSDDL